MARKTLSPCISVCKFKRSGPAGDHCIGCSMTKTQKKMFKLLKKDEQRDAFIAMLTAQQTTMGKYRAWAPAYLGRCRKKGAKAPSVL
ncbi:MAG: DUF1289 domain-containing protein [Pseudomonadota bacterium]